MWRHSRHARGILDIGERVRACGTQPTVYDKRCNVCCYASCSVLRSAKRPIFSRSEAKGGDGSGDNKPQRLVVRCAKPMDAEREQGLVRGEAGE